MQLSLKRRKSIGLALAMIVGAGASGPASAQVLAQPKGKVILTISGKISNTNKNGEAQFDRDMLEALGMESFTTATKWDDGKVTFEGVRMSRLMALVGASGTTLTVKALNDYVTEIPMDDFKDYKAILALKRNGEYMPVSNKGPLFIVYPYDSDPDLKQQKYYGRSAWQVASMVVK